MLHFSHIHLTVSDLERSTEFYRDKLGLHVGFVGDQMIEFDEAKLILDPTEGDGSVGGATTTLGFRTDDADGFFELLSSRGVHLPEHPQDRSWGVRNFYLRDPDGYVIEIEQPLGGDEPDPFAASHLAVDPTAETSG